jgi:hypothetical protein
MHNLLMLNLVLHVVTGTLQKVEEEASNNLEFIKLIQFVIISMQFV